MIRVLIKSSSVLLPIALISCFESRSTSKTDPESIRLEGLRIELVHRIDVAKLKADRIAARTHQDPDALRILAELKSKRRQLASTKTSLEAEISSLEDSMLVARAERLEQARSEMIGKEFDRFQTSSGRVYEQVKVVTITDSGVQIRHSTGTARLGCPDLSESQWEQFGLDEDLAKSAKAAESRQLAAYEKTLESQPPDRGDSDPTGFVKPERLPLESTVRTKTSAFDRKVSLGSSSSDSNRIVARYRTTRRSTVYYYPYLPYQQRMSPPCVTPVPIRTSSWGWSSALPSTPSPTRTP